MLKVTLISDERFTLLSVAYHVLSIPIETQRKEKAKISLNEDIRSRDKNVFEKASPRQEIQTVTCLSVTFDLSGTSSTRFAKRICLKTSFLELPPCFSLFKLFNLRLNDRAQWNLACMKSLNYVSDEC